MCGEKGWSVSQSPILVGSPPHVRGKGDFSILCRLSLRITPACAGKSVLNALVRFTWQDHPRMCGEKTKKIP